MAILPAMNKPLVVLITVPVAEAADRAEALVARRLAACVNILPSVQSVFQWQGAVEQEPESLLMCKTSAETYPALEAALDELHSYDVPECIALESAHALGAYAQWVEDETRASAP